jgi:sulfide dehydrogenase [flavocytochrome c] flavoprotein subunit
MAHTHNRRDFIKFLAAGAATGTLAACASTPEIQKPIGRVVVIGGGFGGAAAAKYIRMWSGGRIEVFLVDRNSQYVSCPMSNLVLGGSKKIEDITLGYAKLRDYGVQVLRDEVTGIDTAKKKVKLTRIEDLPYDRLVLSPGVDFMYDQIPALNNADAQKAILHAWKAGPETVALKKQLEEMRDGGVYILTIPKAPYRCPPGPYERACQVASYLKRAKPKSKVLILDANEDIVSKKGLFLKAWGDRYKGIIEYRNNQEAKDIDLRTMTVKTDFDSFKGDVLNVVPPQKAAEIAAKAGVITTNNRWCGVDWLTMQSTANPDIHVLGDATLSAALMPKSGSMANQHAKVCASGVIALMTSQPVNQTPVMTNTCYSFVSDTEAVHVASVHAYDAKDKTLKTVPGAGGLSTAASEIEGAYGNIWAQNIWADMLG